MGNYGRSVGLDSGLVADLWRLWAMPEREAACGPWIKRGHYVCDGSGRIVALRAAGGPLYVLEGCQAGAPAGCVVVDVIPCVSRWGAGL